MTLPNLIRRIWWLAAIAGLSTVAPGVLPLAAQVTLSGQTMGTITWSVKVDSPPGQMAESEIDPLIQKELDNVNERMSTYRADSEVSRFNASSSLDWFPVSGETAQVVVRALEISELSQGAFDVTVGPLVNLWHFGPDRSDSPTLPDDAAISQVRQHVGYQRLHARLDPPALRKDDPNLQIDLSAIAKGYAVDRVAAALEAAGLQNFLVEVGGEVVVRGQKSDGSAWRIGIVRPTPNEMTYDEAVPARDLALATSGDYRNFFTVAGRRYSHTIDPNTGRPVENRLASASVIAPDCMTADALATAVMVLGSERGHALCQRLGYPLLTFEHQSGGFRARRSGNFPLVQPAGNAGSGIWPTMLSALLVFGLAIAAMAAGVIFGNRRIQGSCGGLASGSGESSCALCHNPSTQCRQRGADSSAAADAAESKTESA
jgi:thiamine biosynthesis lipoprotein